MACGSCKTCAARCSNHPVSCGHALSQRPSPMISQKLSEPLHNLIMKSEPALADLHRIPDATGPPGTGRTVGCRHINRQDGLDRRIAAFYRARPPWEYRSWLRAGPDGVSAGQAFDGTGGDGAGELGVVALVLVGVQPGEPADRSREVRAFPDIAVDGYRVAGPGVGAGERLAACDGELGEAGGD